MWRVNIAANVELSCPLSHWQNSNDYKILHLGKETTYTSFNGDTIAADKKDVGKILAIEDAELLQGMIEPSNFNSCTFSSSKVKWIKGAGNICQSLYQFITVYLPIYFEG